MGIKFNDFIKTVKKGAGIVGRDYKNAGKNVKGLIKDKLATRKSNKKTKDNIYLLAVAKAKKQYKEKTGKDMTPSKLKSHMDGILVPKTTQEYMKNRDSHEDELLKKYNLK